jgi:ADP-heptose:LPS heptosyltransferase
MIEEEWRELCDQFIGERIVFFASSDTEKIFLQVQEFMDNLQGSNSYEFFKHKSWIDLGKMLAHSKGVITYNGPAASLSSYVGAKTLILFDQENPKRTAPFLFEGEINILQNTDPSVNSTPDPKGESIKPRVKFSVDQIFQRIGSFFGV